MSYDRRDFLKSLTLGGIALFTTDWLKLVDEAKATTGGKQLPVIPRGKNSAKGDELRAFWVGRHFELCLNGTIYDEVPEFVDDEEYDFDSAEHPQEEGETDLEFDARLEKAREEWDDEQSSGRRQRAEEHEFDWYRRSCPGARAVPYLSRLFSELEEKSDKVRGGDRVEVGSIEFHDGSCPGNDTYVAATAPDYATLAALQRVFIALRRQCRVVIVVPNPGDAATA